MAGISGKKWVRKTENDTKLTVREYHDKLKREDRSVRALIDLGLIAFILILMLMLGN